MTRQKIIDEAWRVEEDCKISSKRHFNDCQWWERAHYIIGIPSVVLATIAGSSWLSDTENGAAVAGVISIIVAVLTALNTFINPIQKAEHHKNAGNAYLTLRNKSRRFAEIQAPDMADDATALGALEELTNRRDQLNETSSQTRRKAFDLARKGDSAGEASYKVDS